MSALSPLATRAGRWMERQLLQPERPLVAVEVRPRGIGVVRLTGRGRHPSVAAAATLDLPAGALRLSITEPNLDDGQAFRGVLRAALERAGALTAGRVGLVLPDPVARVALLPASEITARGRVATEEMLRFKLRKSLPFEVKDARLAFAGSGPRGGDNLVVAAVFRPVLEAYETACRDVGVHPGLVELSALTLLQASFAGRPVADRLLVNWDTGYVTLVLARGEWPLLVRTLTGSPAEQPSEVAREVANTLLYYRERLGGAELESAVVRSAALPPAEAAAALEEPLGKRPQLAEPWRALGGADLGAAGPAVAGAVACLLGGAA